jgi:hypothetical protein
LKHFEKKTVSPGMGKFPKANKPANLRFTCAAPLRSAAQVKRRSLGGKS